MQLPRAAVFDLDNTLAEPFHAPLPSMFEKFSALIDRMPVAIMSAASLERITRDVLQHLGGIDCSHFTLFTANAAQCYTHEGGSWVAQYKFGFTAEELAVIKSALQHAVRDCGIDISKTYGDQFVDYEGYVAFTALGLGAPREERLAWDPDRKKRDALRLTLAGILPQFDVYIGGATSVDVTPKGINKAYGVEWYAKHLVCPTSDILYVGDALYEGGNDAVVIATGAQTRQVAGPSETETVIAELLSS